jgi:hypothetical protein
MFVTAWATPVARLRLSESSIASCFKVSPRIQTDATFAFCNTIPSIADIRRLHRDVGFVPETDETHREIKASNVVVPSSMP